MKSEDYVKAGRVTVAGVDVIAKFKSCGKENCSQCPHGPVWYAYVPVMRAIGRMRTEVYLGRVWIGKSLLESVGPKMRTAPRRELVSEVERIERAERIKFLENEARQVQQAIVDVVARHQKEVEKLRRDEFAIKKELNELRAKR
jgi:hypothetical protein